MSVGSGIEMVTGGLLHDAWGLVTSCIECGEPVVDLAGVSTSAAGRLVAFRYS